LLDRREYLRVIKFIMWQLVATLSWLHEAMHCCHLSLTMENILLENVHFQRTADGTVDFQEEISIKLASFDVAEIFGGFDGSAVSFACNKRVSQAHGACVAPQYYDGTTYDARAADIFSVGAIFFECVAGRAVFDANDVIWNKNGYAAMMSGKVRRYLKSDDLLKLFSRSSLKLFEQCLSKDEKPRMFAEQILQCQYFKAYYAHSAAQLHTKIARDARRLQTQTVMVPIYTLSGNDSDSD